MIPKQLELSKTGCVQRLLSFRYGYFDKPFYQCPLVYVRSKMCVCNNLQHKLWRCFDRLLVATSVAIDDFKPSIMLASAFRHEILVLRLAYLTIAHTSTAQEQLLSHFRNMSYEASIQVQNT